MSKAQGQFTIIDYNDALTLTGYIGSNLAKTQMYNPDNGSYTPDWKTKNLVLTPSLYVIGTTADQITTANVTSVKWYVGDSNTAITAGTNYALSGAKSHILTVKANVMAELPGIDYRCVITYKDESTGLSLTHPLTISFSRVVNGSGIVDLPDQLHRHLLRLPAGGAVADGNMLYIVLFDHIIQRSDGFLLLPLAVGGIDHRGVQHLAGAVYHRHFTAHAVAGVQAHGDLTLDRGLHEQGL